jgi:uncharacterized caspase-like protein
MRARKKLYSSLGLAAVLLVVGLVFTSCTQTASSITSPRYALVYGIKNYLYKPLTYTVADAQSIESVLESKGVPSANMIEREDSAVTKAQIKADILSLASVSSDSTVIIYYSGHGSSVDSSWNDNPSGIVYYPTFSGAYLVPYDAVTNSGLTFLSMTNLVSPSELQSWIANIGTKNVILVFDSCYSGAFVSSASTTDASPSNYASMKSYSTFSTAMSNFGSLLVANASASGSKTPIVLSACGSNEESYDGTTAMGHGVFTYYLLKAATNGDSNGDGYVTMTEAYAYTTQCIKTWGASLPASDDYAGDAAFLPHLSGGIRDLVLFVN